MSLLLPLQTLPWIGEGKAMDRSHILGIAVVVSLAVATSFITSTWVASRAYLKRGEQQERVSRTLDVTGSAKKGIVSDLAQWSIRVAGEGKTVEDAFQKMSASGDKVRDFLAQKGFSLESVTAGPIRTETHYQRDAKGMRLARSSATGWSACSRSGPPTSRKLRRLRAR
jgi:hypothetical protein